MCSSLAPLVFRGHFFSPLGGWVPKIISFSNALSYSLFPWEKREQSVCAKVVYCSCWSVFRESWLYEKRVHWSIDKLHPSFSLLLSLRVTLTTIHGGREVNHLISSVVMDVAALVVSSSEIPMFLYFPLEKKLSKLRPLHFTKSRASPECSPETVVLYWFRRACSLEWLLFSRLCLVLKTQYFRRLIPQSLPLPLPLLPLLPLPLPLLIQTFMIRKKLMKVATL